MTTLAQITADLISLKHAANWTSDPERPLPASLLRNAKKLTPESMQDEVNLNVRLAAEELALAALIHSELMSIRLPSVSYARLKAKTIPCNAIGGDFFDAVALDNSLCAVVADVSGKGVPAAIVAAMLQGIIHAQMLANQPLIAIAHTVNEFLCSRATGKFATMILLKLSANGLFEYLNCGHIPPVVVDKTGARQLESSNVVVGLLPAAQYESGACELMAEDRIMIFTDGITEAENSQGEQFAESALACCAHSNSVDSLLENVSQFQGSLERHDDWTLFELLYRGGETRTVNLS
jgi:sigma-B regulation protein RsbU (phosphoserine phosphatase)